MAGYEYQHNPCQSEMLCLHVAGSSVIIHAKRGKPSDCIVTSSSQDNTEYRDCKLQLLEARR